jgi:hypothetical protein
MVLTFRRIPQGISQPPDSLSHHPDARTQHPALSALHHPARVPRPAQPHAEPSRHHGPRTGPRLVLRPRQQQRPVVDRPVQRVQRRFRLQRRRGRGPGLREQLGGADMVGRFGFGPDGPRRWHVCAAPIVGRKAAPRVGGGGTQASGRLFGFGRRRRSRCRVAIENKPLCRLFFALDFVHFRQPACGNGRLPGAADPSLHLDRVQSQILVLHGVVACIPLLRVSRALWWAVESQRA